MSKAKLTRREILMLAMANAGGIGVKSLLTGLPIHFLTRRSLAASTGGYLVYASSRSGDPMNCNVPGTYKPNYYHAPVYANPVDMTIGSETHKAASVWNTLNSEIKRSANFFHLRSGTNSHNELDSVMQLFGAVKPIEGKSAEMLPSTISYEMSKLLSTQIESPLALGSILSFKGSNQKIYSPSGIKSLFPTGISEAVLNARRFRDNKIDTIYRELKLSGTPAQKRFLDSHVVSGGKARLLGDQLAEALSSVSGNSTDDRMRTAAALLALNVTPAVTLGLGFGGDNHNDMNLVREIDQHTTSISAINTLYESLKGYGIENKTTFAILNVFGRTQNINSRGGRDHHGPQSVMFSFGPNIKGGVIGDIAVTGRRDRYEAMAINSTTGKIQNPDIDPSDTLKSAAKSLIAATGIEESRVNEMVAGGKIVKGYLK